MRLSTAWLIDLLEDGIGMEKFGFSTVRFGSVGVHRRKWWAGERVSGSRLNSNWKVREVLSIVVVLRSLSSVHRSWLKEGAKGHIDAIQASFDLHQLPPSQSVQATPITSLPVPDPTSTLSSRKSPYPTCPLLHQWCTASSSRLIG